MNKLFGVFIFSLLFSFLVFAQSIPDTKTWGLKGKVKRLEVYLARVNVNAPRKLNTVTVFDKEGNIIELFHFENGETTLKSIYFFDSKGRRAGFNEYTSIFDKTLSIPTKVVFTLDDDGRMIEAKRFGRSGEMSSQTFYKYDSNGKLIERSESYGKSVMTYDSNGNLISQIFYDKNEVMQSKHLFVFNDKNLKTEENYYNGEKIKYKIQYQYDAKNRLLEKETIDYIPPPKNVITTHGIKPGKITYSYNDEKRMNEIRTYTQDGIFKEKSINFLDENENPIGFNCETWDIQTCKTLLEFQYDSNKNWTKKTHFIRRNNGDTPYPYFVEERVISYY